MKYLSTRGKIAAISFKEAVMMGLATDGGLLLPEKLPAVGRRNPGPLAGPFLPGTGSGGPLALY